MPEHTIPDSLIQNIKSGKVALVVGAGLGIPSWKQLIESMNEELRARADEGDEAAAKDIDKLLHKASLVRATSFLSRALGPDACDRHVAKVWAAPDPLPEVAQAIGGLPFRQVWTTFPGEILERAMEEVLPDGWQPPRVLTYRRAGDIDRRRTVLKLLGDFDSFVVTPTSIRQTLTSSEALLDHVRDYYQNGSLLLIGFRYGDPDLAALLDRVFGSFEPPASKELQHFMIASGVGPVTVDELEAEHHIQLINLPGRGADEKATAALIRVIEELSGLCEAAGITLATTRPDADDLEGWLEILGQDAFDTDALDAIASIESTAEANEDWEGLIEVLMSRIEIEGTGPGRSALLRRVAQVFEDKIGDLPRAFTALTAAIGEDPADESAVDEAERLAEDTDGWTELVKDLSDAASQIADKEIAAGYWTRLGGWYHKRLDHLDYAIASYRQSLKLDAERADTHAGLAEVFRIQQRWTELADALFAQSVLEDDLDVKLKICLELGEIRENQLASISKAISAYEDAIELDAECDDALGALERLYRREERWGKLAATLEKRAELFERQGESGRANTARHELATLRAEKLGDLEGAIAKYEAAIDSNSDDIEALRALQGLYEKTGRTPDYLRTLERLSDVVPESEKTSVLRRLGAELEDRPDGSERAIRAYRRILEIDPPADFAHRALARLLRSEERFSELVDAIVSHVSHVSSAEARADLYANLGAVHEDIEGDPHRAIEAHLNATSQVGDFERSLAALARLFERTEAYERAIDVLKQHAGLGGNDAASLWARAGVLASEQLGDQDLAERYLEKALELDDSNAGALAKIADLHKQRGNWASAISRLTEAAERSANRLERIELLTEAAELAASRLEKPERALALSVRVLELDPENREAGARAAAGLLAEERHEEALPIIEMMARTTDENDRREVARWEGELGALCQQLGHRQKAAKHLRRAVEADVGNVAAAIALSNAVHAEATELPTEEKWQEVEAVCRDLLARHRGSMADSQVAEAWVRVGSAARYANDAGKARDAFAHALEREPANLAALQAIVEIETGAERWDKVAEAKRGMLESVEVERKTELLDQIGDLYAQELGDQQRALGAYHEAIGLAPTSHKLLHKTLDIYSAQKDWRRAVECLERIAGTASSPDRRAKYFYAAAVIGRDELGDRDVAAEHFAKALEEDPDHPKAFAALDAILEEKGDYKALARSYRKRLKKVADSPEVGLKLWTRLADICAEHLGDMESAIAAYEVAASLDPDNLERHEQLANLYLEAGDEHRPSAIAELQILLEADPDRVELFKALFQLYLDEGQTDKAYCLAQALIFLGAAGEVEQSLYNRLRPAKFMVAKRRLTEELWQKAILHARESRHVNAIFGQLVGPLSATTAQPPSAFDLSAADQVGVERILAAKLARYASEILGLEPEPELYIRRDTEGVRVANTASSGRLAPSVLIGGAPLESDDERQLAFEVGKRLAYLRPDRYVNYSLGSIPKLESAFLAALAAAGVETAPEGEAANLAGHLRKSVPRAVLEQVAAVAEKMPGDPKNGTISGWRSATELTSNRVGFILCNDLEVAARSVATEATISPLPAKVRLRDLLAYSVSEDYFTVRRHLGFAAG